MKITRSDTSSANCISWVQTIIVIPSSASRRIVLSTSTLSSGSREAVGSSKSMS
ncbi:hypothetical protein [Microbacterium elymi]|uniref:Uncharacterized protein n=1 Tax=Microbacterium elymi TaxID=2909587 RepID=A0ABY5NM10_9MICO|nr:hypothetical protein [Microbacterium elymi]UUT36230.1 hypothetical protein L2X98_24795 [Microbacterium elymi]